MNQSQIHCELAQFTGTENWYWHWTKAFTYTDGVKHMADLCKAHWLIDAIASYQGDSRIKDDLMLQEIQFWTLEVKSDLSATLTCERDTDDVALTQEIEFTDFPLKEICLYLTDGVLLLPTEY